MTAILKYTNSLKVDSMNPAFVYKPIRYSVFGSLSNLYELVAQVLLGEKNKLFLVHQVPVDFPQSLRSKSIVGAENDFDWAKDKSLVGALIAETIGGATSYIPDFNLLSFVAAEFNIPLIINNSNGGKGLWFNPVFYNAALIIERDPFQNQITVIDTGLFNWNKGEYFNQEKFITFNDYLISIDNNSVFLNRTFETLNENEYFSKLLIRQETAYGAAKWLRNSPLIKEVWYPGFSYHSSYSRALEYMNGFGNCITFTLKHPLLTGPLLTGMKQNIFLSSSRQIDGNTIQVTIPTIEQAEFISNLEDFFESFSSQFSEIQGKNESSI